MELRYCKVCGQMTNHEVSKIPLLTLYNCLRCKKKKENEK